MIVSFILMALFLVPLSLALAKILNFEQKGRNYEQVNNDNENRRQDDNQELDNQNDDEGQNNQNDRNQANNAPGNQNNRFAWDYGYREDRGGYFAWFAFTINY